MTVRVSFVVAPAAGKCRGSGRCRRVGGGEDGRNLQLLALRTIVGGRHCFDDLRSRLASREDSNPRIRTANAEDLDLLVDIYADSFLPKPVGNLADIALFLTNGNTKRKIKRQMSDLFRELEKEEDHQIRVFVAESRDTKEIMGFVQLTTMPCPFPLNCKPLKPLPYIGNLSISTDWRRRGVASALVLFCESVAERWGYNQIFLHVEYGNDPATKLYKKLGYNEDLIDPEYYERTGRSRRLYLRKILHIEVPDEPPELSTQDSLTNV